MTIQYVTTRQNVSTLVEKRLEFTDRRYLTGKWRYGVYMVWCHADGATLYVYDPGDKRVFALNMNVATYRHTKMLRRIYGQQGQPAASQSVMLLPGRSMSGLGIWFSDAQDRLDGFADAPPWIVDQNERDRWKAWADRQRAEALYPTGTLNLPGIRVIEHTAIMPAGGLSLPLSGFNDGGYLMQAAMMHAHLYRLRGNQSADLQISMHPTPLNLARVHVTSTGLFEQSPSERPSVHPSRYVHPDFEYEGVWFHANQWLHSASIEVLARDAAGNYRAVGYSRVES